MCAKLRAVKIYTTENYPQRNRSRYVIINWQFPPPLDTDEGDKRAGALSYSQNLFHSIESL
jgi:hypothetical protein